MLVRECIQRFRKTNISFVNFGHKQITRDAVPSIILHGKWKKKKKTLAWQQLQFSNSPDVYTYTWWCTEPIGNIVFVLMVDTQTLSMVRLNLRNFEERWVQNEHDTNFWKRLLEAWLAKCKKLAALWAKIKHQVSLNTVFPEKKAERCLENGFLRVFRRNCVICIPFATICFWDEKERKRILKAHWNYSKLPLDNIATCRETLGTIRDLRFRK